MAKVTFNGEPGETFVNDTGKVLYQMVVSWSNSCGLCIQYDHAVGPSWPIPFHRNCRCKQVAIWPGEESRPFVDFRAKIDELEPSERGKVVGVANLRLIEAGVVQWSDVVTGQRVRDLREVVAIRKLPVGAMVKAGVKPAVAEHAFAAVHTPAHELARQRRRELLGKLLAKGVEKDALKAALGERLAARVGIAGGPGGATAPVPPTPIPPAPAPAPVPRPASKPGAVPVPMPVGAGTRADYLLKARVKPDVAGRLAREERAKAVLDRRASRFAAGVLDAAAEVPDASRLGDKAFIHHVYGLFRGRPGATEMSYPEFQRRLVDAHQRGKVELSRADLVEAMSPLNVRLSATPHPMGGAFNFVRVPAPERSFAPARKKGATATATAAPTAPAPAPAPATKAQAPPGSIAERLAGYAEGDRKVASLVGLGGRLGELLARRDLKVAERKRLEGLFAESGHDPGWEGLIRLREVTNLAADLQRAIEAEQLRTRAGAQAILKAAGPMKVGFAQGDLPGLGLRALKGGALEANREAEAWLSTVVADAGHGRPLEAKVAMYPPRKREQRAFHAGDHIAVGVLDGATAHVHEFGHLLEDKLAYKAARAFLDHRVGDEPMTRLRDVLGDAYGAHESGRKDRFDAAFGDLGWYVGKKYPGATEVMAMGLEKLYEDPVGFALRDPEYCKFVLGILDGSLR